MSKTVEIVGIGLCTLDVLIRLRDMPTWERGGEICGFGLDGGGPVGTGLVAAQKLGARTGYLGTCGNDRVAQLKMEFLAKYGVDISRVKVVPEPERQVVIVYVEEDTGERVFAGFWNRRGTQLQAQDLDRDYILAADYLHLDGWHLEAALQAARWMHEADKTVVYDGARTNSDAVRDQVRELIPFVDVLICGEGFGRALTGRDDVYEAGRAVLDMGPRIFVQTMGEKGCYTVTADEAFHTPAFEVKVVDTTGAGDVFHGAYIVGLQHGWDLESVAYFASAVSALKCQGFGGREPAPTFDQVMDFLRQHGLSLT